MHYGPEDASFLRQIVSNICDFRIRKRMFNTFSVLLRLLLQGS